MQIELQRIFTVIGRTRVQYRTEKNWAFVEGRDGDLILFYQVPLLSSRKDLPMPWHSCGITA